MANYYFDCECGVRNPVKATQADSDLRCRCGKVSRLPALSKLSKVKEHPVERLAPAQHAVAGPARALMMIALLTIIVFSVLLGMDKILLISNKSGNMTNHQFGISRESQIAVRMIWIGGSIMLNVIILFGAVEMSHLKNYGFAKTAAALAIVPCFSLCFFLSMPFGVSALLTLNRPEVRDSFS